MSTLLFFSSVPGMAVPGMAQPGRDGLPSLGMYQYLGQAACFYLDYLDARTGHTLSPVPGGYYTMAVANPRAGLTVPPPGRPWNPGNPGAGGTFAPLIIRRLILSPEISHGHYQGASCGHCDPEAPRRPAQQQQADGPRFAPPQQAVPPPLPAVTHGHYPGATCGHCDPGAPLRVPLPRRAEGPDVSLAIRPPRPQPPAAVSHGHYAGATCGHCDPAAPGAAPLPRRSPGPDAALQDYAAAMTAARAHTAARLAVLAREPGRPQPQGSPGYARVPASPPPSAAAADLAAGRAHNAARLAAMARGEQAGGR